jgi:hypothetical protein
MMEIPADPTGLPSKIFNLHLDSYMETGELNPEILPMMNEWQQGVINEVKKSFKRLKNKYARQTLNNPE